jgi:hypothetical protein
LAQARKVDVILVTELTRWGRSARFAARSLTCFKFRFVSSPLPERRSPPFQRASSACLRQITVVPSKPAFSGSKYSFRKTAFDLFEPDE